MSDIEHYHTIVTQDGQFKLTGDGLPMSTTTTFSILNGDTVYRDLERDPSHFRVCNPKTEIGTQGFLVHESRVIRCVPLKAVVMPTIVAAEPAPAPVAKAVRK